MRARPREINIFNMSLLDILCGALGAFCFMMLVALPYYVVGTDTDRARNKKETEDLLKDVEKLREQMTDPAQAEELRKMLDRLEAQIKQLEGQVNQYANENEQLKTENSRLTSENRALVAENQRLRAQTPTDELDLASRKPFLVVAAALDATQDVALFLEDEMIAGTTDKTKFANGTFDPNILRQTGWEHDLTNILVPRKGVTLWISSTTRPQSRYRVFVKYQRVNDSTPFGHQNLPTRVHLSFGGGFVGTSREVWVSLAPERFWALAGTLDVDDKGQLSYKDATEAERDEAWRTIMKTELPTPAPDASGSASSNENELRLRRERIQREQQLRSPSPSGSLSPTP